MSFLTGSAASNANTNVNNDPKNDVELVDPPPDSISGLAFSPTADFLAVSSWDNNVSSYFLTN